MPDRRRSISAGHAVLTGLMVVTAAPILALTAVPRSDLTITLIVTISVGLLGIAALRALARSNSRLRDLEHRLAEALTDPVTGLPVRRVAEEAIATTNPDVTLTVALADVDRLHDINHGPGGHAFGDRYLAEVGLRLRQASTTGDVVARLGGDEFVLITRRTPDQVAHSVTHAFAGGAATDGFTGRVEASVGICRLPGSDSHHLFGCAGLAMLTAKTRHSGIEIYDPVRDGLPLPAGVRPAERHRHRRAAPRAADTRISRAGVDVSPSAAPIAHLGEFVAVAALHAAVSDGRRPWLEELLVVATDPRRRTGTAEAAFGRYQVGSGTPPTAGGDAVTRRVLSFDEAEAAGFDGTGTDGDPRFPYTTDDLPR